MSSQSHKPITFTQWRRGHFKSGGHKVRRKAPENHFTVSPTFCGIPMTGNYRKMQGRVTRTELEQRWQTRTRPKRSFDFSRSCCVKGDLASRYSMKLGWFPIGHLLTPTPYHAAFQRYCTSILKHIFDQFRGPRPTLWRLKAVPPNGFGLPPNTWLLLPCMVCTENQLDRPSRMAGLYLSDFH